MSSPWNSLYCPSENVEAIIQSLQESLTALGYQPYNPFSAFPGKSYPQTVRLFVAPPAGLYLQLDGTTATIRAYAGGQVADVVTTMTPCLRAGQTAADLEMSLKTSPPIPLSTRGEGEAEVGGLPFGALPDDVQALASQVDKGAAEKMFNRLSGQLMKKVGGQNEAAQALVKGEGAADWGSAGGRQIRAIMACLSVPENWREPDFTALRDAYPLYERLRRNPNAKPYPGDEATMAKVPNALDYTPIYGGKNL
jgi:hypothetical protein